MSRQPGDAAGLVRGEGARPASGEDFRESAGEKRQAGDDPQYERREVHVAWSHGLTLLAPVTLFVSVYIATFLGAAWLGTSFEFRNAQWFALVAVVVATMVSIAIFERRRFDVGLRAAPLTALRELTLGFLLAAGIISAIDLLIQISSGIRHPWLGQFPWREMGAVYLPAVFHEELAFRGYLFQKLHRWRRAAGFLFSAGVFALLHLQNHAVTMLAVLNIAIAGILLALAWERFGRLWFPIGIHFVWNVLSGPILGYGVSGYESTATLFSTRGAGPSWLTGGSFGLEGSVCATVIEILAVVLLARRAGLQSRAVRETTIAR